MHIEEGILQESGMVVLLRIFHLAFLDMDGKIIRIYHFLGTLLHGSRI
jgi:hypothetical protein